MADIYHDFIIKSSAAAVYDAMATPGGLEKWWTKRSSGKPAEGMEYSLWFGPPHDWQARVSKYSPSREFELIFTRSDPDWQSTRVGFQLEEKKGITHVRFYHLGWPALNEHYRISNYCWAMYLRLLKRWVENGEEVAYEERLEV